MTHNKNEKLNIIKKIKLIIIEIDGCVKSPLITFNSKGKQMFSYSMIDENAIKDITEKGFDVGLICNSDISKFSKLFKNWKLSFIIGKVNNKLEWINKYIENKHLTFSEIAFIGYHINDLNLLMKCGLSACPNNAHYKIKSICKFVSEYNGGDGAIYECLDLFNFNGKDSIKNKLLQNQLNQNNTNANQENNQEFNDMHNEKTCNSQNNSNTFNKKYFPNFRKTNSQSQHSNMNVNINENSNANTDINSDYYDDYEDYSDINNDINNDSDASSSICSYSHKDNIKKRNVR
jgi:3-deoxy-D-manno-octulosonate 8-phosphate phosphatase (KDO 8-P phosphatase)